MLADANERDRKAEEQDQKKKNDAKLREVDRLRQLDMQVQSKKNQTALEREENKRYVKMVLDQDEEAKKQQKDKQLR